MTSQAIHSPVRTSITVGAACERAFAVFVEKTGNWWSADHYLGAVRPEAVVLELPPAAAGSSVHPTARSATGAACWRSSRPNVSCSRSSRGTFAYDPDPALATEVEVRFIAQGPSTTRVELEHRGFEEVHGDARRGMRDTVGSPDGWGAFLRSFAAAAIGEHAA